MFFAPKSNKIIETIDHLRGEFDISIEQDVGGFLGADVAYEDQRVILRQPKLIERTLMECGMADCNTKAMPAEQTPLGMDADGTPFNETRSYPTAVSMLMYLCTNSHLDIQFAVH